MNLRLEAQKIVRELLQAKNPAMVEAVRKRALAGDPMALRLCRQDGLEASEPTPLVNPLEDGSPKR